MCRQLRSALLWLLLLALPVQGFAAATMVNCGPNHHRRLALSVTPSATLPVHGMREHHAHGASATADPATASAHGSAQNQTTAHPLDTLGKVNCSACAACWMGAAVPTAALVIASSLPAITTAHFIPVRHLDFLSDGLDRPPRLPLA